MERSKIPLGEKIRRNFVGLAIGRWLGFLQVNATGNRLIGLPLFNYHINFEVTSLRCPPYLHAPQGNPGLSVQFLYQ